MKIKKIKKLISFIIVLSMIMTNMSYHITFATEVDDYVVEKTIKVNGGISKELSFPFSSINET